MKSFFIQWACSAMLVCFWTAAPHSATASLLPEGLTIQDVFEPGSGPAIGRVTQVEGEVILIHRDGEKGYRAASGVDLYEDDTVVTLVDSHAAFRLTDGSFIALAPETKMVIVKSDYVPEKKIRSTFVNMIYGKARSVVQPLVESRRSRFTVKTTTAVAGVRGSDFIVYATDSVTEVSALEDTRLEVIGLAALDADPLILTDFEQTRVFYGMPPEAARRMTAEEVDQLTREFRYRPDSHEVDADVDETPMILSTDYFLHPGDGRFLPGTIRQPAISDDIWRKATVSGEKKASDMSRTLIHQKLEETVKSPLPDFPGKPQE